METRVSTPLDRPATELTIMDVYDIAAVLGHEFERVIDRFGCEPLVGLVHKVVRVLELLEALVSHGGAAQEADELRRELDRLRQERSDRFRRERKHQKVCARACVLRKRKLISTRIQFGKTFCLALTSLRFQTVLKVKVRFGLRLRLELGI